MAVAVSMANDGRDVHPFFVPKANVGNSTERGFDVKNQHSKRRKTKSLVQQPVTLDQPEIIGWAEQLIAAASGASPSSDTSYIPTDDQDNSNIGSVVRNRVRRVSNESNLSVNGGSQNSRSTFSPRPIDAGIIVDEEDLRHADPLSNKNTTRTPPKKMLKVRSDGKLGSPKAKVPALDAKPKRGRKPAKASSVSTTLFASIRYGTDAHSRSSVGCKIAEILSGTAKNLSYAKSQLNKPTEPPKPTHPFFLGGLKRDQQHHEVTPSNDNKKASTRDGPVTSKQGAHSPTKARVTSKPPGMSERAVGSFGFGGSTFTSEHARVSRFPGAMEPSWPPEGMVHVRQDYNLAESFLPVSQVFRASKACCKMKDAEVRVPKEEQVLTQYVDLVQAYRSDDEVSRRVHSREWREFRRPLRRILTGRELQQDVRRQIVSELPMPFDGATCGQEKDRSAASRISQGSFHPAVHHMYKEIRTSRSAFDNFECETQDWVHKYAPACADQVLQAGHEVYILRDWLKTLTVNSVGFKANDLLKARDSSASSRRATTKRKRRRAEELDGFVLSSDEEANEMCQATDSEDRNPTNSNWKKSVIRSRDAGDLGSSERVTNAVVISGPRGCGKTAAVYAVARELGFEVFEINAGCRRSGKDILDKVGDMSRNHLVKHTHPDQGANVNEEAENMELLSEKLKQDLDSGRQGTMQSFFKPTVAPKKSPSKKKSKAKKQSLKQDPQRKQQNRKQSLIFLEEVDVLFDEDKTFWATTLELLVQSKRPVIMTCTDENLLPLEDMTLYAILRFMHTPEQLAIDYLLLLACNEGHILPRDAVINLYKSKDLDLRASIAELNFFCQMAIGDTKGGLEWMLIKPTMADANDQDRESLRVVSEGTYLTGMGWLGDQHQISPAEWSIDQEIEMLAEAWYGWGLDVGACEAYMLPSTIPGAPSQTRALQQLQDFDLVAETLSAADIFPGRLSLLHDTASVDPGQPDLTDKARSNYVEGFSLIQADPVIDQTGVSEAITFTINACGRRLLSLHEVNDTRFNHEKMISMIIENLEARHSERPSMRLNYAASFEPIARFNKPVLGMPKGPQISAFDGSLFVITEDLAPYVRSIVSYDIRLEEQRERLSSLLAQPGQNSKRQRTTRASRAALEGGNKASTRRERWFPTTTNFDSVLQSGGKDWQDIALKQAMTEPSDDCTDPDGGSRRDSLGSVIESDH